MCSAIPKLPCPRSKLKPRIIMSNWIWSLSQYWARQNFRGLFIIKHLIKAITNHFKTAGWQSCYFGTISNFWDTPTIVWVFYLSWVVIYFVFDLNSWKFNDVLFKDFSRKRPSDWIHFLYIYGKSVVDMWLNWKNYLEHEVLRRNSVWRSNF